MKCDNCDKEAIFTINDPGANQVFYCSTCLPGWLSERASLGQLDLPKKEAPKSSKKKATEEEPSDESN